jgi:hypothetical protein
MGLQSMYSGLSKAATVQSLKNSYYEDAGDVDSTVNLGHFSSSSISLRQEDTCSSSSFIFLAVALSSRCKNNDLWKSHYSVI